LRNRALKGREIATHMVEHAIENDAQPPSMRRCDQRVEVRVVA